MLWRKSNGYWNILIRYPIGLRGGAWQDGFPKWIYTYVNDTCNDFIRKYDESYWEWIYDIGDVIHPRLVSYLVGLQMVSEQLSYADAI